MGHGKMWQNVATYGKLWQPVRTLDNMWQTAGDLWPFCENPVCPDPVWKAGELETQREGRLRQSPWRVCQGLSVSAERAIPSARHGQGQGA